MKIKKCDAAAAKARVSASSPGALWEYIIKAVNKSFARLLCLCQECVEQFWVLHKNDRKKSTALLNWKLLVVEVLPEEDAVLVLLICLSILRSVSEIDFNGSKHMDYVESYSVENSSKIEIECLLQSVKPSLIPGLPDDVALSCLARVPRKYHPVLNCVSKRWRELVTSEEWFSYRQIHQLEETWIYSLCRDKSEQLCIYALDPEQFRRGWKQIHGFPGSFLRRKCVGFEVLGKKIYLFGGCGWIEVATRYSFYY
ncbi:hypothetical protein C2S51_010247 [Perilla frutescens var. frutescens]|nr:hypothetical protein C2S51_010247 [Perilla frutescens var. frutescens]